MWPYAVKVDVKERIQLLQIILSIIRVSQIGKVILTMTIITNDKSLKADANYNQ
jgi:hypothetical protein